jgi:ABC-type transport system involved in multi-copper enzyme maturation permease subunit
MVLHLVKWSLLQSVGNWKYVLLVVVGTILGTLSGIYESRRIRSQEDELAATQRLYFQKIERSKTFSTLLPLLARHTEVNSIFIGGASNWFDAVAILPGLYGNPVIWNPFASSNPYLVFSFESDFSSLIVSILILYAILLSCNVVVLPRQNGNLKFLYSYGVSSRSYLFSQFLSCSISVFFILVLVTISVMATAALEGHPIHFILSAAVVFVVLTQTMLTCVILMGIFISIVSRTQKAALTWAVCAWVGIVWLWPTLVVSVGEGFSVSSSVYSKTNSMSYSPLDSTYISNLPKELPFKAKSIVRENSPSALKQYLDKSVPYGLYSKMEQENRTANSIYKLSFYAAFESALGASLGVGLSTLPAFEKACTMENIKWANWQRRELDAAPLRSQFYTERDTLFVIKSGSMLKGASIDSGLKDEFVICIGILLTWLAGLAAAVTIASKMRGEVSIS